MRIQVDTHTHSVASLHAYSTIDELARGARLHRMKGLVITEHGPAVQGGFPHPYFFSNMRIIPAKIHGVRVFHGVELNIIDAENPCPFAARWNFGGLDLKPYYIKRLDFVMAGFHEATFPPRDTAANTAFLIRTIENPLVDGISHPGNPPFPVDYEAVVLAATKHGKTLEINNSSFATREGSAGNCRLIAELCKKHGCLVTVGSDAHYWRQVGVFPHALPLVNEIGLAPEQVVNSTLRRFEAFIEERKKARTETRQGA